MEFTAKVFFDNILQNNKDISNIEDLVNLTIERDYKELILRDKTEAKINFKGCAYNYFCEKYNENQCGYVSIRIEANIYNEQFEFDGQIRLTNIVFYKNKKIIEINAIKDNSFSSYIQDIKSNEVPLYSIKTLECSKLDLNSIRIIVPNQNPSAVNYTLTSFLAFDIIDVLKYLIGYFSDNKVGFKSNYFTLNKLAITTGYNMHNSIGSAIKIYPKLSISKIVQELFKKHNIFTSIEYDINNNPYFSIEKNSDYYNGSVIESLFDYDISLDFKSQVDFNKIFTTIDIGSSNTNLNDNVNKIMENVRGDTFNKESYNNCSGCRSEKDVKLDLVSEFVIDSNVIHEILQQPEIANFTEEDYSLDDNIFLISYENVSGINRFLFPSGYNIPSSILSDGYNNSLNNKNSLQRHLDTTGNCFKDVNLGKYGFRFNRTEQIAATGVVYGDYESAGNIEYDINGSLITAPFPTPPGIDINVTYFECQETGTYKFKTGGSLILDANISLIGGDYTLVFKVFSDNTLSVQIYPDEFITVTVTDYRVRTFLELVHEFILLSGNCVVVQVAFTYPPIIGVPSYPYIKTSSFELVSDDLQCEDSEANNDEFRTNIVEFSTKPNLCLLNKIRANKKGYFLLNGQKAWVESVKFNLREMKFKLITKDIIC